MDHLDGLGSRVFVTDFDGTMTRVDFYEVLMSAAEGTMPDAWAECVAGRMTHVVALNAIFQHASHDPAVLRSLLPKAQLDPRTPAAVERWVRAGWDVVVVSAGATWYIEELLAPVLSLVRIIANPSTCTAETGLTMGWPPQESPWYSAHFGVDKGNLIRALQTDPTRQVYFAGDGRPDITAARLVTDEGRFARGWLAETLAAEGLTSRPFDGWADIADAVLN